MASFMNQPPFLTLRQTALQQQKAHKSAQETQEQDASDDHKEKEGEPHGFPHFCMHAKLLPVQPKIAAILPKAAYLQPMRVHNRCGKET